ncbi:MAG: YbjN domain-containing protein [Bifidobacteriaceae bacterium]|jgi:hypothetical protein|nr:YbjN domain-containing protein [Bifidobacteriaceae bacterium]
MADIERVRATVERYLKSIFNQVTIDSDGDYSVRAGSARVFIRPEAAGSGPEAPTVLALWTILLRNVNAGPELYEHIAFHADDYRFGHLSLHRASDGGVTVLFSHQLLADYLDEPELGFATSALVRTADELDDELQSRFGGTRFHER